MDNCHDFVGLARKIAFFVVVGFAVIFLTGPVLALLSLILSVGLFIFFFLLPFALLGLIVWLPLRAFFAHKGSAGRQIVNTGKFVGRAAFVIPVRACGHICSRSRNLRGRFQDRVHAMTCFIGTIFVETASGALVGALLGAIAGFQSQTLQLSIPAGSIIGAGLGIIVGASRVRLPQPALSSQTSDGLR